MHLHERCVILRTVLRNYNSFMDALSAKLIAAGIATLALFGVGIGIGNIFSSLISSIARNPSLKKELMPIGMLGFALTESIALFALLVVMLILFVV